MDVRVERVVYRLKRLLVKVGVAKFRIFDPFRTRSDEFEVRTDGIKIVGPRQFFSHFVLNDYEPMTRASFRRELRPGMIMIDIGAHIGFYAALSARLVGPKGRVHAFEPFDENIAFLRRNMLQDGAAPVDLHPFAAGEAQAERMFHVTGSTDSNGFFAHPMTETVRKITVGVRAVDDIVSGRVDAVKIDVEGAEILVLKGMSRILRDNPDIVLWIEWAPHVMRNAGHAADALPRYLESLGFGNMIVLDDAARSVQPMASVLPDVMADRKPAAWYANILVRRD